MSSYRGLKSDDGWKILLFMQFTLKFTGIFAFLTNIFQSTNNLIVSAYLWSFPVLIELNFFRHFTSITHHIFQIRLAAL